MHACMCVCMCTLGRRQRRKIVDSSSKSNERSSSSKNHASGSSFSRFVTIFSFASWHQLPSNYFVWACHTGERRGAYRMIRPLDALRSFFACRFASAAFGVVCGVK